MFLVTWHGVLEKGKVAKKKKYSTVVIFDKHQGDPKSLAVRTEHLDRWKWYVLTGIVFIALLFVALLFYARQAARNERAAELLNKYRQEVLKPMAIDTNVAKAYIEKIDHKLVKIEKYLRQRGVEPVGKPQFFRAEKHGRQAIRTYIRYAAYLNEVLKKAQDTPMGYPLNKRISSGFGYRGDPFHSRRSVYHHGIDIDGDHGDRVNTTANGTVISAGWNSGYGNCIIIRHQSGYETLYGHLSKISVRKGEHVRAGQCIGLVGSTGHSTGNHLHYEVHRAGKERNPVNFLAYSINDGNF
jgi:murein DD-endopeptidase MepM/ murein hydrolase activator NlpD